AMSSASNSTGVVAPGLALTLTGTNAGAPTQIGFSNPAASIGEAMQDLVSALNEVVGDLNEATDPLGGGPLSTDSGARSLKRTLSALGGQIVMPNAPAGA